ncbi:MAG: metallophosphoesterase [Actinomycetota bacterium]
MRPRDLAIPAAVPPPRPRHLDDLRFRPQPATRWFSPGVLAQSGLRVALSGAFGQFLDKRELQASVEAGPLSFGVAPTPAPHSAAASDELWVDFIADTGDGFGATYTVAWLSAQHELRFPGVDQPLPRADVVVLGGDEVYPVGDAETYEQRFVGPFRAALPWTWEPHPELFALAGNHDWYDGLTAFMRIFCQRKWVGGRQTRQTRSYFAVELPHRWWLWGIDIQLDSYIDEPQLRYFEDAVKRMRPGDRVVLCTAEPSWLDASPSSRGRKNLAFLENRLIRPSGARLMLTLSGDLHHYSHYVGEDASHKVTAGGGGAFLHPTHTLAPEIETQIDPADEKTRRRFTRTACYPDQVTSRRLAWGAVSLPVRNPSFMVVPAVVYVLLAWSSQFSLRAFGGPGEPGEISRAAPGYGWVDVVLGLVRNPLSILLVLAFAGGLIAFAKPPKRWPDNPHRLAAKIVMGTVHLALHLALVVVLGLLAVKVASALFDRGAWFTATLLVLMGAFGGFFGGLATGLYLAVANAVPGTDAHSNEAFSAMRLTSYKNFLRLHFDAAGVLHVYPVGVRRAHKDWVLDPDNADAEAPWLAPDGDPPVAHLIERPFSIDGRTGGPVVPPPRDDDRQPQVLPLKKPGSGSMET